MPERCRERSFGAVIFSVKQNGERDYLLLHNVQGHWDFPKGRAEPGETPEETIRREVGEESGITGIKFIAGFKKTLKWKFRREGVLVGKIAVFRLARTKRRKLRISREHNEGRWVSVSAAMALLRFANGRKLLGSADRFLCEREAR